MARTPNDDYSIVNNPNNPAYHADKANTEKQRRENEEN